ncbi:MAG: sigma-70 family RNA polymerase sigma factor [Verrucomicrobiales bacterium]|nr:sigma-70 family RNA polymerase sigma factor [Verrucomicrobiae bacterium]MCP5552151.1 sigma-70 family RNA polymerase sigma factor [Akkermansiaceae bacterium]HRX56506.1 sigma-70 family RNA polymerase sigma factor [Verrucomicrobiales bacterium]
MSSTSQETRFIEALTRHQPALEAFCHALVARREDAREILQGTCVKLWEKAGDWDPETAFLPWAFTVSRFVALSHARDKTRDRLIFDEDVMLAMADETETAVAGNSARREALDVCLKRLQPQQLGVLNAHYLEGRGVSEIARATGRGESAIKMTLLRLRQLLRQCIEHQLGTTS